MKKYLLLLVMLILIGASCVDKTTDVMDEKELSLLTIGNKVNYNIEVRDDAAGMAQGLSGRESLPQANGMLFKYDDSVIRNFWMKDMNFPLDFVWIRDLKVVGLSENVAHPAANNGIYKSFPSPEPADMVLEINAGQIMQYGITFGDVIYLK